jgi:hypothetical protein
MFKVVHERAGIFLPLAIMTMTMPAMMSPIPMMTGKLDITVP